MLICKTCGRELAEQDTVCPDCGMAIVEEQMSNQANSSPSSLTPSLDSSPSLPTVQTGNVAVIDWKGNSGRSPFFFQIAEGRAVIGRFDPDSGPVDIDLNCLPEDKVEYISRHHAEIWRDETGQWFIKDLESANGTFYKEKQSASGPLVRWARVADKQPLYDGCNIALGNVPFEFHVSDG